MNCYWTTHQNGRVTVTVKQKLKNLKQRQLMNISYENLYRESSWEKLRIHFGTVAPFFILTEIIKLVLCIMSMLLMSL